MPPCKIYTRLFLICLSFFSVFINGNKLSAQTIAFYNAQTGTSSTVHPLTSVPAGALLVLVTMGELHSSTYCSVSSSPSLTWTKRVDAEANNSGDAEIWTAVNPTLGNITVTSDWPGAANQASVCYVITGQESTLGGAGAYGTSQSAPSVAITTTRANSIVLGGISDWNAINGSSRTYRNSSSITERLYHRVSSAFTAYSFSKSATTINTYTEGLTAPTGQSAGTVLYEVRGPVATDSVAPSSFTLSSTGQTCATIDLSWTAATDNVGVTGYEIYVNGSYVTTTTNLTYTVTGLSASTQYSIYVKAKDAANNSTNSNTITPSTVSCPASCVTIVSYNTATGTGSSVNSLTSVPAGALLVLACQNETHSSNATVTSSPSLTWTKRADAQATNSGDAEIWTAVYTAGGNITVTSDFGNNKHSSVCYVLTGYDAALGGASATGNSQSAPSVNITTTKANSLIIGAVSDWNAIDGSSRTYRDAPTETFYHRVSGGFTTYNFYKITGAIATYTEGLTAPTGQSGGTVLYEIKCATVDTTAPTAPTLSSTNQTSTTITIAMPGATDNVGVTGYNVYLNGNTTPFVTNVSTPYTLTGLTPSTQYSILVKAKDAAGNLSTASNTITPSTTAGSACTRNNLLLEGTFENPDYLSVWDLGGQQYCTSCAYAHTQSTEHVRAGSSSIRFEVRKTDPLVSNSRRTEIEENIGTPTEGERWYGGSWFLPATWTQDGFGESILQWHDEPSSGSTPPFAVCTWDGHLWGRVNILGNATNYDMGLISNYEGAWMDIVLHIKWTNGNTGFIEAWVNGTKKMGSGTSNNSVNIRTSSTSGQYLKLGMNKFNWASPFDPNDSPVSTRIFYVDEFRIGNQNATYDDVAPCASPSGYRTVAPGSTKPADVNNNVEKAFFLNQNFPNPANGHTTIRFTLPQAEKVNLSLFDVNGRIIKLLVNGSMEAGTHTVNLSTALLSKGVYYYKIQAGNFTDVKKLTIQ